MQKILSVLLAAACALSLLAGCGVTDEVAEEYFSQFEALTKEEICWE